MEIIYLNSFYRDLKKLNSELIKQDVHDLLLLMKTSLSLLEIPNVKKMEGVKNYYRIKMHDYRIGVKWQDNKITIYRFLHRKDIYKYFP
jgi:mRNA interferase RelE/StbE